MRGSFRTCLFVALVVALSYRTGEALIINGGNAGHDTVIGSVHENDFEDSTLFQDAFDHVGLAGGTGIYLGYGWVLTAGHLGTNNLTLDGVTYLGLSSTSTRLHYPGDPDTTSDLRLFKLDSNPGLSALNINHSSLIGYQDNKRNATSVIMAANGRNQQDEKTYWTYQSGVWTEVAESDDWDYAGYMTVSTRTKLWGRDRVHDSAYTFYTSSGNFKTAGFATKFEDLPGDSQAVTLDSGSATFVWNESAQQYELAGVVLAVSTIYLNQPGGGTNSAVHYRDSEANNGGNTTLHADLARYADQIAEIVIPDPGDMNADGLVTNADITPFVLGLTDLQAYAQAYPGYDPNLLGDFTGDGLLTNADISGMVAALTGGAATAGLLASADADYQALLDWGDTEIAQVVPAPAALVYLVLACPLATVRRRRR